MKINSFKKVLYLIFAISFLITVFLVGCSNDSSKENNSAAVSESSVDEVSSQQEGILQENAVDDETAQKLKDAYAINNDVVGWLIVDGCEIDNRIFQATDNDKYLRLDEYGNYDVWGCYFLDYINIIEDNARFTDKVSIVYGHSFEDDAENEKFSKLKRYRDASFASQHPELEFVLHNGTTKWQIFSACQIPVAIDYIDPNPDAEKYQYILDYMIANSYVDFGVEVTTDDQILVLSTCTSNENVRFIIAAKLIK